MCSGNFPLMRDTIKLMEVKPWEYMEENYMYRLTLSSISANVNLAPVICAGFLNLEDCTSITNYLNNLRIRKAATLIKENTMSMKEISSMVGIDDQLYFSRLFKKCMEAIGIWKEVSSVDRS